MTLWPVLGGALLLCLLANTDVYRRKLPNTTVTLFASLHVLYWWLSGRDSSVAFAHITVSAAGFLLFSLFYALRWMAGGDVKLAAAVLLWAGPEHAAGALTVTALTGICLAVGQLLARPYVAPDSVWHVSRGTPYGVALAVGGLWAVWRPVINGPALF